MGCSCAVQLLISNSRIGLIFLSPTGSTVSLLHELFAQVHFILDWPDAIQTSPTRMFLSVTLLPPFSLITISRGSKLALSGSNSDIHFPLAAAAADTFCPAKLTVTVVPGLLQPHTGTFM